MTDTIMGIPTQSSPEWTTFDFNLDQNYDNSDAAFLSHSTFTGFPQPNYDLYNPDAQPTLFRSHEHVFPPRAFLKSAPDHDVTENRRVSLTQQQTAVLEETYQATPRPKTETRRTLAEKLGLDFTRVNIWYQNRRQKGKSQKRASRSGSDGLSTTSPPLNSSISLSVVASEASGISNTGQAQHYIHDVNLPTFDFDPDSNNMYNSTLHRQTSHPSQASSNTFETFSNDCQSPAFGQNSNAASSWTSDLDSIGMTEALNAPSLAGSRPSPLTSQSLQAQNFSAGIHARGNEFINPSVDAKLSRSRLRNNESTQTLNSSTSSFGDNNGLFTHSEPALPWLSSEFDSRRTSASSELAHNVEGMHLQQGPPNLGLITTSLGPSRHSSMVSATGVGTPDTSPEQFASRPFGHSSDLASRRKRQTPIALRPDPGRSISYNDPISQSPHSRTSSINGGQPAAPRRSQSSGQMLHNHFRVCKPSNHPTQLSPRNIQTHFEKHSVPYNQRRSGANSTTNASPTTPQHGTNKPSASAASANRSPAEYQNEFHVRSASTTQQTGGFFGTSRPANASVPDLHSSTSQALEQISIRVPCEQNPLLSHRGPPLSAPPNQTTFFDESPPHFNGPFPPPGSTGPQFTQPGPNDMTYGSAPGPQSTCFASQAQARYLPPFAPQYTFPDSSQMTSYPGVGVLSSYPPGPLSVAPAPPVELDIKVELGPEPQLSSRFDRCEFQHTFSHKWGQGGEKK